MTKNVQEKRNGRSLYIIMWETYGEKLDVGLRTRLADTDEDQLVVLRERTAP